MRQLPRTPYCDQCGCPMAALAPPPALGPDHGRAQRLPAWPAPQRRIGAAALGVGLACASVGWLPVPLGIVCSVLAVICGSVARQQALRCRRPPFPIWLAWAAIALGGAAVVPALSGL